jgi:hypothetical protein
MELEIRNHPKVNDVLVVGHGKFQSALLIELKSGETAVDEGLVEDIWPLIEKLNKSYPGHARIVKRLIMFTKQDKPLARTPKGTIQRRKNYELYQEEIDELYAKYTRPKLTLLTKDRKALLEKTLHLFSNSFRKCYRPYSKWRQLNLMKISSLLEWTLLRSYKQFDR